MIRLAMVAYERGDSAKNIEWHGATTGCNVTLPGHVAKLFRD